MPGKPAPVPTSITRRPSVGPPSVVPFSCAFLPELPGSGAGSIHQSLLTCSVPFCCLLAARSPALPGRRDGNSGMDLALRSARCLSITGSNAKLSPMCLCQASSGSRTAAKSHQREGCMFSGAYIQSLTRQVHALVHFQHEIEVVPKLRQLQLRETSALNRVVLLLQSSCEHGGGGTPGR